MRNKRTIGWDPHHLARALLYARLWVVHFDAVSHIYFDQCLCAVIGEWYF